MIATTLPIKLSDVCLELYGNTNTAGRSLNQAFTDAISSSFDATYDSINGYRNSLQNFRGYGAVVLSITRYITVGGPSNSYYGYIEDFMGSVDNNDISIVGGPGAYIYMAYGGGPEFQEEIIIYIKNNPVIEPPIGTGITINGVLYTQASSFIWADYTANGWHYRWRNMPINPFGTTVGAIIPITFTT